ncbi:phage terminase small subunit P27 family [Tellurirhabdus bombi]|uniref:phage terminase small subunit P27 family n=1 Tax=Tellurirhabdus bombi TaxID=2907205 RepID=UPI001F280C1E|nr:phage terminase small subunit P27 family [Tellurirhabdus bombi]
MPGGRPRKPVEVKILEGTHRKDREVASPAQPTLLIEMPEPPCPLGRFALGIWVSRCTWLMDMNLLGTTDREALAQYCIEMANYFKYNRFLEKDGEFKEIQDEEGNFIKYVTHPYVAMRDAAFSKANQLSTKFGFTPGDRSKISAGVPKKQESKLEKLMKRGR